MAAIWMVELIVIGLGIERVEPPKLCVYKWLIFRYFSQRWSWRYRGIREGVGGVLDAVALSQNCFYLQKFSTFQAEICW